MRAPNDTDFAILLGWLDRRVAAQPGTTISIVSPVHGALCGYVPERSTATQRFTLSNAWFDPYWRSHGHVSAVQMHGAHLS